jgi:hypothetical protein
MNLNFNEYEKFGFSSSADFYNKIKKDPTNILKLRCL